MLTKGRTAVFPTLSSVEKTKKANHSITDVCPNNMVKNMRSFSKNKATKQPTDNPDTGFLHIKSN